MWICQKGKQTRASLLVLQRFDTHRFLELIRMELTGSIGTASLVGKELCCVWMIFSDLIGCTFLGIIVIEDQIKFRENQFNDLTSSSSFEFILF